jgi:hypothetical protein
MGELKIHIGKSPKGKKHPKPGKAPGWQGIGGLFGFGRKKDAPPPSDPHAIPRRPASGAPQPPEFLQSGQYGGYMAAFKETGETEIIRLQDIGSEARLRRDGSNEAYPAEIMISGGRFSIGRYDKVLGKTQNDVEFDENTIGISRRHAIIENIDGAYFIVQIGEKTDTYVNGQRIAHSVPHPLNPRDRVSFNRSGADYIFEV